MHRTDLAGLSDDALVSCLSTLCAQGHALTARVIVHLIEVEERRLDLRAACTSMFDFCTRRLGMSEGAAFRRITAARLVKRFPALLERIERGEVHLSTLVVLRPHLTESNVEELAAAAAGKTRREVEDLLARLAPKPDVPSAIVELGIPSNHATPTLFTGAGAAASLGVANAGVAPSVARSRIEPLSEARFKVQLTAGAELKAKLERACDLMRHRNPNGRAGGRDRRGERALLTVAFEDGAKRCAQRAIGRCSVSCRAHNRLAAEEVFGKAHVAERIDFRHRKSRAVVAPSPVSPPPPTQVIELALRGLRNMGFCATDARRAVDHVAQRPGANGEALDLQDVIRGALVALT